MGLFDNIKLPCTPEAESVRKYLQAQEDKDFSRASEFFTEDVVFNGLLYKISGRETLATGFKLFATETLTSIRLEAVNEAGSVNRYMVLHWVCMKPSSEEQVVCDLISLRDGKISRVDNCFDVSKTPDEVKVDAKKASA